MRSVQAKRRPEPARETYRTLQGWALGILLETRAIREREDHSHMQDRADPDVWRRAREIASQHPFRGATAAEAVRAIEDTRAWRAGLLKKDPVYRRFYERRAKGFSIG